MARNTSVMGIYTDRSTVSDAINVLQKTGYRATDTAVLWSDNQASKDLAHEKRTKALEGAATGAAAGAMVGAALAWFLSVQTGPSQVSDRSQPLDRCWPPSLAPAPVEVSVGAWGC